MFQKMLSILLITYSISVLANESETHAVIRVQLNPSPHLKTMRISGLNKITSIVTAGHYAWAYSRYEAKVSFYNGKKWSKAERIPGITCINNFYPAYPVSGSKPDAWVMGCYDENKQYLISHFNGQTWSEPRPADSITGIKLQPMPHIKATGGYVFLLGEKSNENLDGTASLDTQVVYSIFNPAKQSWSKAKLFSTKFHLSFLPYNPAAYNDINPSVFFSTNVI